MTRARRRLRLVVAAALFLSACGGASDDASTATPAKDGAGTGGTGSPGVAGDDPASSSAGHELLAFTAPAIGGGSVEGVEFRGRPTLLWFWSPW